MLMDLVQQQAAARRVARVVRPSIMMGMEDRAFEGSVFWIIFGLRLPEEPWYRMVHYEQYGDPPRSLWEYPVDQIAGDKARLTGRTGLSTRKVQFERPQLLLPGDTRYFGSWTDGTRIVAGSGFRDEHDHAICEYAGGLWVAEEGRIRRQLGEAAEREGRHTY